MGVWKGAKFAHAILEQPINKDTAAMLLHRKYILGEILFILFQDLMGMLIQKDKRSSLKTF